VDVLTCIHAMREINLVPIVKSSSGWKAASREQDLAIAAHEK
jgi:hypothetical protein